jgi:hypothetical protein
MEHTKQKRTKRRKAENIAFETFINGRTFSVNATPFTTASGDCLYRVSYNNGPVHIFGWDDGLNRFTETDTQADIIPPVIEMAIAEKLNEKVSVMQHAA